ncbi:MULTISPECIES: DUF456 domain-containing protein [Streptomycetaceae]|uniref:DUF456 domain-containing protein n=1 Tax=Streptantibioticus cattleyicolor (strain ATCC 35852 / DSM 46488 / JCM 4925 / NBRC 14057 / NRRL 8057) TaxID=1003195 RepID=F8JXL2_STREN|nr:MULTISPECIES: DUF456 domain-containing protein [Streptomycetaceae]AEW97114.1 hypothetical protein SCATT_47430 [Streptantibioticus cattleyicolor NRRL 8057 = DSM 46488]MYS61573.1 DUF456 family protein [Streptomyces sp. SID5468]CCB77438.1 Small hydrophobic protein [Streptantibioticus cattleyicolor NRRL 8057 = DSM 46488]
MGTAQLSLVGMVLLAGVLGVLTPGLPGPLLCWAGLLWWAAGVHTAAAWSLLGGSAVLLAAAQAFTGARTERRIRESGVPRDVLAAAGACAIAGFFVLPVAGAVLAFVGVLHLRERARSGDARRARAATRTVMRVAGTYVLVELMACLVVTAMWMGVVLAG